MVYAKPARFEKDKAVKGIATKFITQGLGIPRNQAMVKVVGFKEKGTLDHHHGK